jgi:PKD repeat protein
VGAESLERDPIYNPGDRPMPVGPGQIRVQYAFAAVAASGSPAPTPTLPDCSQPNRPPQADFSFQPASPGEGRVVMFSDRSVDPDNNITSWSWEFGDPLARPSPCDPSSRNPCHLFSDNGTLPFA